MKKALSKVTKKVRRGSKQPAPVNSRITSDTIADHREEVLGKARKYIYPLQHSKHRLVVISLSLFVAALVTFFVYCVLALYKFQSTSTFIYKVTQVIPFPIARTGSDFVAYENYLFEVKRYTHYYHTQQSLDFNSEAGQQQLGEYKKRALEKVINDAYIKEIAAQKGITVSNREVEDETTIVRNQNRLGASDKEFQSVLRDFWNWSEADFKRSLKAQLLREKVLSVLDTKTHDRANAAHAQLKNGKDFNQLAEEISKDPAGSTSGGEYDFPVEKTNRDIDPDVVEALFKLKDGEHSGVIDVGYGLEIVKRLETRSDGKLRAAHIAFNFSDMQKYLDDQKASKQTRSYLSL